jgi:signal transduction histidine kinase
MPKTSRFIRKNKILVATIAIFLVIAVLAAVFSIQIKQRLETKISNKLSHTDAMIAQSVTDLIRHTEFLMTLINERITENPQSLEHIANVINKYQVNPEALNVIPWTYFDWIDKNADIVVNAANGILDKPVNVKDRDYVKASIAKPNKFHFSEPLLGRTSKRWIIVESIGVTDAHNKYLGINAIGYDLNTLSTQLKKLQTDENVQFFVFNKNGQLLIDSAAKKQGPNLFAVQPIKNKISDYIDKLKTEPEKQINVSGDAQNHLISKIGDLPFYVYLTYNPAAISSEFWEDVISRLLELLVIGIIAIIIAAAIYKHESNLRKKAEESYQLALSASKGKSEFLAYTGHELRSPLNVIIFGSEMMKSRTFGDLPPKYAEYAEDIYQNGNDLLHFIEDLMEVTKAEESGFTLHPEYVNVSEIIDRVIRLNITRATKLPPLWADPRRLRQILNNLISNAIKYSPENTTVKVIAHSIDGITQIIVEDKGFGMDENDLDVALSKYGTVKNENSGKVESVGLGLPLVKKLVESHKAKFDIKSSPKEGTSITISFTNLEHRL